MNNETSDLAYQLVRVSDEWETGCWQLNVVANAAAVLREQHAEIARLKADAARLDWLEAECKIECNGDIDDDPATSVIEAAWRGMPLREAIDRAMKS